VNLATAHRPKRILAVDDNEVILCVLSSGLTAAGYQVITATDGAEAFHKVLHEKPDLILLDLMLPPDIASSGNTWDGFVIMDWLQKMSEARNTPVIVITGGEPEDFRDRCFEAGALAYFQKPIEMPDLLANVHALLDVEGEPLTVPLAAIAQAESARVQTPPAFRPRA